MSLPLWYCREQTLLQNVSVDRMVGDRIEADKLSKLASIEDHSTFTIELLGLALIGSTYIKQYVLPKPTL